MPLINELNYVIILYKTEIVEVFTLNFDLIFIQMIISYAHIWFQNGVFWKFYFGKFLVMLTVFFSSSSFIKKKLRKQLGLT